MSAVTENTIAALEQPQTLAPLPPAQVVTQTDAGNILVIAEQPGQLQAAQGALLAWFAAKLEFVKNELAEQRENLDKAKRCKWSPAPFQKLIKRLEMELTYYEKAVVAVECGYCIVPEFPVEIMAIRVSRESPWGYGSTNYKTSKPAFVQGCEVLPVGEGDYVSPNPKVVLNQTQEYEEKDYSGKPVTKERFWWEAEEFREVRLPVKFMKSRVLEATQHAMAQKIFDEIGIIPARKKSDPIVVGRIHCGNTGKLLTFMISWFIDSKDL